MANFTPRKKTAQDFNNGVAYVDGIGDQTGDALQAETINNVIEGFLYTQGLAVNQPDTSEADNVGIVEASIITAADGSARLKLKNLKGEQGVGIQSITTDGVDTNGGNKYLVTLTNGQAYSFVAPKGDKGDTGNGIYVTLVDYATSTSNTVAPTSGWQKTIPAVAQGSYLWTRTEITYTDGKTNTSYSVTYQGRDGTGNVLNVNGQTGAVTITPANIGAVNKSGDTMTGELMLSTQQMARGARAAALEYNGDYAAGFYYNAFELYDKCFVSGDGNDKAVIQWSYSDGWRFRVSNNGKEILNTHFMDTEGRLLENGIRAILAAHPVGSIYISTNPTSPASLFGGSWEDLRGGYYLKAQSWSASTTSEAGDYNASGLPNITGSINSKFGAGNAQSPSTSGALAAATGGTSYSYGGNSATNAWGKITFDASQSNSIYGRSNTVTPLNYTVYMWRRVS
ncbi:MAG: hypothetical protein NC131_01100 [Roseburia sp.]|nr:hypothetical protein [Roseburia sp.]